MKMQQYCKLKKTSFQIVFDFGLLIWLKQSYGTKKSYNPISRGFQNGIEHPRTMPCPSPENTLLHATYLTRGVTRDFPGNEMSFRWNYSTM